VAAGAGGAAAAGVDAGTEVGWWRLPARLPRCVLRLCANDAVAGAALASLLSLSVLESLLLELLLRRRWRLEPAAAVVLDAGGRLLTSVPLPPDATGGVTTFGRSVSLMQSPSRSRAAGWHSGASAPCSSTIHGCAVPLLPAGAANPSAAAQCTITSNTVPQLPAATCTHDGTLPADAGAQPGNAAATDIVVAAVVAPAMSRASTQIRNAISADQSTANSSNSFVPLPRAAIHCKMV